MSKQDNKEVRERLSAEIQKAVAVLNAYGQCKKADSLEKAYAVFSQPPSEGSGEVGLRWIKASERLPVNEGEYFVKFTTGDKQVLYASGINHHNRWLALVDEWLEEYTLPSNEKVALRSKEEIGLRWVKELREVDRYLSVEHYENGQPVHRNNIGAFSILHRKIQEVIKEIEQHINQPPERFTLEESREIVWEAWKEVYRINCSCDGSEFEGYDWSMVRLEFNTWWEQQSVMGFPISTEPKIPVTKKYMHDHKSLCAFFTWFRNNGENYIGLSIEQLVDKYLNQQP